tara:strand:- start:215 stop:667 length:453 start_codon:yes stop_codon:yes gene_type:complete
MRPETDLIKDGSHIWPIRVYLEDSDTEGVVYYANYLRYAERARTEMLRSVGCPHTNIKCLNKLVFAVRRCEVDYLTPARLDDELVVISGQVVTEAASLWIEQRIQRGVEEIAKLLVRLVCIGKTGKPVRLPKKILCDALLPLLAVKMYWY